MDCKHVGFVAFMTIFGRYLTGMTRDQQQFIELLRAGLWGERADESLFRGGADWKEVLKIARQQTVQGVVCDSIETLPQELWPPKDVLHRLMMDRTKNVQMHGLLNSIVRDVVEELDSRNVPSLLLKGQGVAQNYRRPESRSCGDIDLYVGMDNFHEAGEIIGRMTGEEAGPESDHHIQLHFKGVEIELHKKADYMPGVRMNRDLQAWTVESLDKNFGTPRLRTWDNSGTAVQLAPATFDAFFILHHAVRHMTTGGIGFRQLCDWTMYLHKHHTQIDTSLLKEKLERFRMKAVWQEFGILAVNILGLPAEELPFAPASMHSAKTEKLLRQIFISGNFGHADEKRKDKSKTTYIKRKWRSFRFQSLRLMKLIGLFPMFILTFCLGWISEATIRLMKFK